MTSIVKIVWRQFLRCRTLRPYFLLMRSPIVAWRHFSVYWPFRHYHVIFSSAGLGDLLMVANAIRAYKRTCPEKKFAIVLSKREKTHAQLLSLFDEVIDKVLYLDLDECRQCLIPHLDLMRTMVRSMPYSRLAEENFVRLVDKKMTYPRECFGGKIEVSDTVRSLFGDRKYQIGRTILICPSANSCAIPKMRQFWSSFARMLEDAGYCPVFNVKDSESYSEFPHVFLNIVDTIGFAELAGNVISVRSGICDVLAYFTTAKMTVLWPDANSEWNHAVRDVWTDANGCFDYYGFVRAWSIKRIFPRAGIEELINEDLSAEQLFKMLFYDRGRTNERAPK